MLPAQMTREAEEKERGDISSKNPSTKTNAGTLCNQICKADVIRIGHKQILKTKDAARPSIETTRAMISKEPSCWVT